jgi:hypothetical protein
MIRAVPFTRIRACRRRNCRLHVPPIRAVQAVCPPSPLTFNTPGITLHTDSRRGIFEVRARAISGARSRIWYWLHCIGCRSLSTLVYSGPSAVLAVVVALSANLGGSISVVEIWAGG